MLSGTAAVAVGLGVAQVAGYAQTVVAARALGPADFGAFAALLGLLLIGSVVGAGFQAAGARRLVSIAGPDTRAVHQLQVTVLRAGLVVGLVALALTPAVTPLLDLPTWVAMPLIALTLVPVTMTGGQYGAAQGRERLYLLGAVYAVAGLGKAVGGVTGALVTGSLTGALIGLCLGAWIAIGVGWLLLRPLTARAAESSRRDEGAGLGNGVRSESMHAAHALAALYVLTNIDVIVARAVLPATDSGGYAVGAIVAKIAFWLPQFITVAAFPRLADERRGRALPVALLATCAVGVTVTVVTAASSGLVLRLVGGPEYAFMAPSLWMFALAGSVFALAQALVFARIAMGDRRTVIAVWLSSAVVVGGALLAPRSTTGVVLAATTGGLTMCVLGLLLQRTRRRAAMESA